MIQISMEMMRGDISKHRLLYYPCPFDLQGELEEVAEFGLLDYIEEICIPDPIERMRMRTPLRFDYAPLDAADYHPASHLTIIGDDCRIPLRTPLLFEHFIKFVFENFYLHAWKNNISFRSLSYRELDECASAHDVARMHLSWVSERR
jgi:hypothetical protein